MLTTSSSQSLFGQVTSAFRGQVSGGAPGLSHPGRWQKRRPAGNSGWGQHGNGRFITWQSSKNDVENWALEKWKNPSRISEDSNGK